MWQMIMSRVDVQDVVHGRSAIKWSMPIPMTDTSRRLRDGEKILP